jgi:hypothetical protein
MKRALAMVGVGLVASLWGCGGPADAPRQDTNGGAATRSAPPPPTAAGESAVSPDPAGTREIAEPGVGTKGRGYGGGIYSEPIRAKFRVEERLVFDIRIPDAMNKFKALEGRAPKSHDEFMKRIIEENSIVLPQLPDGDRYIYDPATEKLLVEHPAP